ncbi:MAG: hypothetical protein J6X58_04940 [Bacteroidales bacterium]|nr:hypothetical protein [Bacteroidales bacterium]
MKLGGWIDAQYRYEKGADNESGVFQIRRARLDFKGSLTRWLDYRLQTDFAPNPRLIDAFATIKINEYLQLQVGQFKIPFSLENKLSPLDLELTDNAQAISTLSGYNDITGISSYANGRDIGAMLSGKLINAMVQGEKTTIISYYVGLFGGNGINVKTDNMVKDISARIELCPFVRNLTLSVSGYWGKYNMHYTGISTNLDGYRIRYAGGAQYTDKHWVVRTEYLFGQTEFVNYNNETDKYNPYTVETIGCYLTLGYWLSFRMTSGGKHPSRIAPLARIEYYDKGMVDSSPAMYYSAGFDWWIDEHLRIQLAYNLQQNETTNQSKHKLTTLLTVRF